MGDHFLGADGREQLKDALEKSDDPLKLIDGLHVGEHFDFSVFQELYEIAEFGNMDVDSLLSGFVEHQKGLILNRLKTMDVDSVRVLLKEAQPYSALPFFEDVIRAMLERVNDVPTWLQLPESMKADLSPADKVKLFKEKPQEFEALLESEFEEAMCDWSDSDNFTYLRLFGALSPYCFSDIHLYQQMAKFCERKFLKCYHTSYCVIRLRMALAESPFSKVDPLRPLSILVVQAVKGEANFQDIDKAASICPEKAQIILSLPQFILKYQLKRFLFSFGIKRSDKDTWARHLDSGDAAAVEFMHKTPLFARVIGLSVVQKTKLNPAFVKALVQSPPQCDVAYMLCRNFDYNVDPILQSWASQSAPIFIDYITLSKARGFGTPNIDPPELSPRQQTLYDNIRLL